MQKYISLFFLGLICLTACKRNSVPNDIIQEQQMISLLTDIHLTDGAIYSAPQVPDSLYKYGRAKYDAVFKKHHTTDAEFKKSLKYYSVHPEQVQDMYNKIDAVIKAKIDSINKASKKPLKPAK
ncbi:DUF4296 domain-containing protein [Mucilaginibacter sp. RB4R14]|uniref:DUF4296 domain-containing protein n=1 Tax=Mucilaginibacter aurantiaciroseus TaxID=2949308 RepID=UPI0020907365|nr:DUF4296 domain-containing protein [Mucilaginibacter aurantiaciroseus]MCO5934958.1 DUF4296 domain-containing protein [Mucilaginibacter aurantiaciroseus]